MRRDRWRRDVVQVVTRDGQTMRGVLERADAAGVELRMVQYVAAESPRYGERNPVDDLVAVRVPLVNLSFYTLVEVAA